MAADTNSDLLGLLLQGTGNNDNSWGDNLNQYVFAYLETAIAGLTSIAVTGGSSSLTSTQHRNAILEFTGTLGSDQTVTVDNTYKIWLVNNLTSGSYALKFKTASGSAVTIPQGGWAFVWCDGDDNVYVGNSTADFSTLNSSFTYFKSDTSGALVTGGGTTAYTLTTGETFSSLIAGLQVSFQMNAANTGTSTLNVDSLGAKPLRSAANVEVVAGALAAGAVYRATYFTSNGGEWLLHDATPIILADNQVTTGKIADGAVTLAKQANLAAAKVIGSIAGGVPAPLSVEEVLNLIASSARGDILVRGASDWARLAKGSAGQVLASDGTDTAWGSYAPLLHVVEQQSAGISSSNATTTLTWIQRVLNAAIANQISGASLASNQITLPAGTYEYEGWAVLGVTASSGTGYAKCRLRDVTNNVTLTVGNTITIGSTVGAISQQGVSYIYGSFTAAGTVVLQFQSYQTGAVTAIGLTGGSPAENEIYSKLMIRKIA